MQRGEQTNIKTVAVYQQFSAEAEAKPRSKIESSINTSAELSGEAADADTPVAPDAPFATNTAILPASKMAKYRTLPITSQRTAPPHPPQISMSGSRTCHATRRICYPQPMRNGPAQVQITVNTQRVHSGRGQSPSAGTPSLPLRFFIHENELMYFSNLRKFH